MEALHNYFSPVHFADNNPHHYDAHQIGAQIEVLNANSNDWGNADIVILGCGEQRGAGMTPTSTAPDKIRAALYELYYWHTDVKLADAGNIIMGERLADTYSALVTVLSELYAAGKKVVLLGGSHDLTLPQYTAFQKNKTLINAVVIDSLIDLKEEEAITDKGFLMEMLTGSNNYVRHFTHLGFQSYYVNPAIIQTLDRLRFDCVRLGVLQENMDWVEPDLRAANLLSIDMNVLRSGEAPYLDDASPNGLYNNELCQLMKYAAMNDDLHSVGIYGYTADHDLNGTGAKEIAQTLWYYLDGMHAQKEESSIDNLSDFEIHEVAFTENNTQFIRSMRTGRWWMRLLDGSYAPCAYKDYLSAASNEMPERWLRHHERIV